MLEPSLLRSAMVELGDVRIEVVRGRRTHPGFLEYAEGDVGDDNCLTLLRPRGTVALPPPPGAVHAAHSRHAGRERNHDRTETVAHPPHHRCGRRRIRREHALVY